MKNKTNEEILREQLELLAERSKTADDELLLSISLAMLVICQELSKHIKPKSTMPVDLGGGKHIALKNSKFCESDSKNP